MSSVSLLGRLRLVLLAAVAGGVVMVLELAAPRLVAPHLGTTVLTWTVVIATFLGGVAWGNHAGGLRADRAAHRSSDRLLPLLLGLAAATAVATLGLERVAARVTATLPHGLRVLVGIPLTFLPVAFVLGTIPPVLARTLLRRDPQPGRALGWIAAAGALGSVGGTTLSGFVLVPQLGTRSIFLGSALVLLLVALLTLSRERASETARATAPTPIRPPPALRRWAALAALAGAALLTLEILAGRFGAEVLGNSLYTWTSVVGVVLGGLAIGNVLGGWLADRYAPRQLLGLLLLASALATLMVLWAPMLMEVLQTLSLSWMLTSIVAVAVPFALPSIAVGTLSPAVIRAALADPENDGRVVGGLYAAGTLGAVAATVLVGYVLIPWLGLTGLTLLLTLALIAAGGLARRRVPWVMLSLLVILGLAALHPFPFARDVASRVRLPVEPADHVVRDTRYFRIRVKPAPYRWVWLENAPERSRIEDDPRIDEFAWWDPGRNHLSWSGRMTFPQRTLLRLATSTPGDARAVDRLRDLTQQDVRVLSLDRLVHSYVNLHDPTWLGYDYERIYAGVLRNVRADDAKLRALFLGGGGFAFQRRLLARGGEALRIVTVEIDPAVTETAFRHLALAVDERHEIVHEDARTYVDGLPGDAPGFDVVFGDAFNDMAVPFHLTTREFAEALSRRMTPDGVYLVNVIDKFGSGRFVGAFLVTLESVFEHVYLLSVSPRDDDIRDTFVLVASHRAVPIGDLVDDFGRDIPMVDYDERELRALRARADHRVLTDDHAPVEILLTPVIETRSGR